jgi:hypothetical protein
MTTKVKTGNQEFEIPDEWVRLEVDNDEHKKRRDELLRRKLGGLLPSITNGVITVRDENSETVVRVTAQLGTKALPEPGEEGEVSVVLPAAFYLSPMHTDLSEVHRVLREAPPYLPPVFALALRLKWEVIKGKLTFERLLAYQPEIQQVLDEHTSNSLVEEFHRRLVEVAPPRITVVPLGF